MTIKRGTRNEQIGGDHYTKHKTQPWDIIEEYNLDFWLGNVVKYILRHRDKGGVEDLMKALHYLDHAIAMRQPLAKRSEDLLQAYGIKEAEAPKFKTPAQRAVEQMQDEFAKRRADDPRTLAEIAREAGLRVSGPSDD
jgi:hypothetical protein